MSKYLAAGLCLTGLLFAPPTASAQIGSLPVPEVPVQPDLALDELLGGGGEPPRAVDPLLDALTPAVPPSAPAVPGAPSSGPSAGFAPTAPDGPVAPTAAAVPADTRAPGVHVTVGSRLRRAAASRRLVLRVVSDEPAVVAVGLFARAVVRGHRTRLLRPAPVLLSFASAGTQRASFRLPRRSLRRARAARLTIAVFAIDAARNHTTTRLKRRLRR